MNSRQRVQAALTHQRPDRIPIDFWASSGVYAKIERELSLDRDQFMDRYNVDLRYLQGPRYCGPARPDNRDIWGVERRQIRVEHGRDTETYSEVTHPPLADADTVAALADYPHWPSPDWFDYSGVEEQCNAIHARGRVTVFMGDRLNRIAQLKPAMYLRGMENILMDMVLRPALAEALFARISSFYAAYLTRILESAQGRIDIVLTGDDFGTQRGLLMAPATWRRLLAPGFRTFMRIIREHDAWSMHHTCGSVRALLPDLIEAGLQVLQSLQPEAADMNCMELADEYGQSLCFNGGLSVQQLLPFGTPETIDAAVARLAGRFRNGGYLFGTAHNIQADTPIRNILALVHAYQRHGG